MINLVLIFPFLACLILFLFKKDFLNNLMINLYAGLLFIVSFANCFKFELIPAWATNPFFYVSNRNLIFLAVLSLVFVAFAIYNTAYLKNETVSARRIRHYTYMVMFFVFSMVGAILSSNLGLTWVFIEGTTLASAYLIYFHKTKHSIEAVWKYVFICSIGIALAFVGIILLTVATGSLNSLSYNDLFVNAQSFNPFWLKLSFVFLLFGIGTKMGLAPVHFWLPDAHAEAPSPVSALLSATLLNSAYLMILNVFNIVVLAGCDNYARLMMLVMGFLSLFVTAVFVYHINNYKRMLAYSSVENMGILIIGTAIGGPALMASIIHLIGHSLIKASFFLTSGNVLSIYSTKKIKSVNGLLTIDGKTGWLWLLSMLGITAFPPSVLFVSEFIMVKTMLAQGKIAICIGFLLLLLIILYGLAKSVLVMCFSLPSADKKKDWERAVSKLDWRMYIPQFVLLSLAFILGVKYPAFVNILVSNTLIGF